MGRLDLEACGAIGAGEPNGSAMTRALVRAGYAPRATSSVVMLRPAAQRGADSLDAVFGTGPFSHQLVLSLDSGLGVLDALVRAVADAGAVLQALNVAELDGGFSAKIWVKNVSCDAARRLSDTLAALPAVTYAHVEHHLGRPNP